MTLYHSTRNGNDFLTSSQCILQGLSKDGGLFVTDELDRISFHVEDFLDMDYNEIAWTILSAFFDDFSEGQLKTCVNAAYNTNNFETEEIVTLKTFGNMSFLELFRGSTIAFKDAALSILPHLMRCAKENCGEKRKIVILTATSGDTGKAALEGFKNIDGIDVIVFYPHGGVSDLQLLQMLTQEGDNVFSVALEGNFDDAQTNVKAIFNDKEFNKMLDKQQIVLSSANSINIGRLIPQIVYYYAAYVRLVKNGTIRLGEAVNFAVPTGNFGNILAGYYAGKTGLPIHKLLCASNENNVLYDFFSQGVYNKNRPFKRTISPSMDILISSNLERLVYEFCDRNADCLKQKMSALSHNGVYDVDTAKTDFDLFYGGYATEAEILSAIKNAYESVGYLMDTHTATAYKLYCDYNLINQDPHHTVILSTASPFKFSKDVYGAIDSRVFDSDVRYMYELSKKTGLKLPKAVDGIEFRAKKEETVIVPSEMEQKILEIISR